LSGLAATRLSRAMQLVLASLLFMPTFLWAIGLANFRALLAYRWQGWLDGLSGSVVTMSIFALPLVALATARTVETLGTAPLESTRFAGVKQTWWLTARYSFPVAVAAALFAALIAIADPGASQIMGYHGAASEILIAFSARHEVGLAVIKSLGFAASVAPIVGLGAWICTRGLEPELSGADLRRGSFHPWPEHRVLYGIVLVAVPAALLALPGMGLLKPLAGGMAASSLRLALIVLAESSRITVWYALTAGVIAGGLGFWLAALAGRSGPHRRIVLIFSFLFLALTPAALALGLVLLSTNAPAYFDFFARSGWMVGLGLGLRFAPLGAILALVTLARIPPSLHEAATVHALSRLTYYRRVVVPLLFPTLVTTVGVIGLLSLADVSTTMLLMPPGESTYASRIFSVIDSASARLVAALCLVYFGVAVLAILIMAALQRSEGRRKP
jgi:iron(III) transport system permease protein